MNKTLQILSANLKTNLICLVGLLLCLPASASGSAKVTRRADVVYFNGEIDRDSYIALQQNFLSGVRSIVVTSLGGSVEFGQLIGEEIARRNISVTVDKYCLSACANYIFLAAEKKRLLPASILGFHGSGLMSPDGNALDHKEHSGDGITPSGQTLEELSKRDVEFFRSIQVDQSLFSRSSELTTLKRQIIRIVVKDKKGNTKHFNEDQEAAAAQHMEALIKSNNFLSLDATIQTMSNTKVYFPSKKKLIEYGVKGIAAYPYPSSQVDLAALAKKIDASLDVVGDF